MKSKATIAMLAVVAVLIVFFLVLAGPALTDETATPSPSASPSLSISPIPAPLPPASLDLVRRALRQRARAHAAGDRWNHARSCLSLEKRPLRLGNPPARSATAKVWRAARDRWVDLRIERNDRFGRLWDRMNYPGGSGWERWRPLVRWIWPAGCVDTVIRIMHYESGGNPRILNGGYVLPKGAGDGEPNSRAGGLMQNMPAPRHWADPYFNLWYAFHKKFISAGWSWSPWAGCAAF